MVPVDDVLKHVLSLRDRYPVEGVTFLGGEPFGQAESLAMLAQELQKHGLSIMTYSGYGFARLIGSGEPAWQNLLSNTDILVEGPFLPKYRSGRILWRGSINQRILLLSQRYSHQELNERALYSYEDISSFKQIHKYHPDKQVVEIHLSNLVELDTTLNSPSLVSPLPEDVIIWEPERMANLTGKRFVEKGIIAIVQNSAISIFGHQTKESLSRLEAILDTFGINVGN